MNIILLFPPGWSLVTGSPHLAIPLLKTVLESNGIDVISRDLNLEAAEYFLATISPDQALKATENYNSKMETKDVYGATEALNEPFFEAEDKIMTAAAKYDAKWNASSGFRFNRLSGSFSEDVFQAIKMDSPFTKYFTNSVMPWIKREDPALVGISIASPSQLIPTLHLCHILKQNKFRGFIVLGGSVISRLLDEFQRMPQLFELVDGLIIFQGEIPLLKLCQTIRDNKKNLEEIPNLIWNDKDTIRVNSIETKLDPNAIPTPDFDGMPVGRYWGVNYLPLLGARGCYYGNCLFCDIPYGYGGRNSNGSLFFGGTRRAELIFSDMTKLWNKYKINRFKFVEETLVPTMVKDLSTLIINHKSPFEWEGYVRLESCWRDPNFVRHAAEGGFRKAWIGLEIIDASSRNLLNKNDKASDALLILKNFYSAGVKVHIFVMVGFPGTGRKEAKETVEFILKHEKIIDTCDIVGYTYSKQTHVPNIEKLKSNGDLALKYNFAGKAEGILNSEEIAKIADEMDDLVWETCPRLIHPTYRLISPWQVNRKTQSIDMEDAYTLKIQNK